MDKTTWFDAESAVNQGFADKIMFAEEIAPTFAASETPMIPHDFIEKWSQQWLLMLIKSLSW